jgi:hypothetical protein
MLKIVSQTAKWRNSLSQALWAPKGASTDLIATACPGRLHSANDLSRFSILPIYATQEPRAEPKLSG